MPREIDWQPYFAKWPTSLENGSFAWLRWIERRKWWIGPRTAATGDPELMRWHYRNKACVTHHWKPSPKQPHICYCARCGACDFGDNDIPRSAIPTD